MDRTAKKAMPALRQRQPVLVHVAQHPAQHRARIPPSGCGGARWRRHPGRPSRRHRCPACPSSAPSSRLRNAGAQSVGTEEGTDPEIVVHPRGRRPRRDDGSVPMTLASTEEERFNTVRAVHLAVVAALGGFLFGFDTAVINGAVSAIGEQFGTGPFLLGFAVASALIGCAIGAWYAGRIADRYGRIRVMLIAAALFIVSAIGCAPRVQRLGSVVLARRRRPRRRRGIRDRSRVHRRGLAARVPRPARLAAAARDRHRASSSRCSATRRSSRQPARRRRRGCWAWRRGAGCSSSRSCPPLLYGALALTIPESPRYLIARGEMTEGQGGAQPVRRRRRREGLDRHPQDGRGQVRSPAFRDPAPRQVRSAADRVDRHRLCRCCSSSPAST